MPIFSEYMRCLFFVLSSSLLVAGCGNNKAASTAPVIAGNAYILRLKPQPAPVEYEMTVQIRADLSSMRGATAAMKAQQNTASYIGVQVVECTSAEGGNLNFKTIGKKAEIVDSTGILKAQARQLARGFLDGHTTEAVVSPLAANVSGSSPPFQLPEQAVKVGDAWQFPQKSGTGTGKVVGIDRANGREMLKIELTGIDAPGDNARFIGPVRLVFDPDKGIYDSLGLDMETIRPDGTKMMVQLDVKRGASPTPARTSQIS